MQKINCSELQLKLDAIATKRKAIGVDFSSIPLGGTVNLPLARKIRDEMKQMRRLIEETEQIVVVRRLSARTKEGIEVKFELKERLEYWRKFYKSHGVTWIKKLPDQLFVSREQAEAMEKLMAEGFDYMLIIPDGLVDEYYEETDPVTGVKVAKNQKYEDLHALMSKDYVETSTAGGYDRDGRFQGACDCRHGLRIILTKSVQNLQDDALFKETLQSTVPQLKRDIVFKQFDGLAESEYLIFAQAYWEESKKTKHLDEKGWTWLTGSTRPMLGRVSFVNWHDDRLSFCSNPPNMPDRVLGCRLAGVFPIKT